MSQPISFQLARSRWIAVLIGLGFGAVLAYEFWPFAKTVVDRRTVTTAASSHLVAQPGAPVAPVPSDPKLVAVGTDSSVSMVPLALVLVGTLPGRNASDGKAMLGTDARNAQTYLAGAVLENGARLIEIHRDRVILERQQQRATLYLQGSAAARDGSRKPDSLLMVGGAAAQLPKKTQFSSDPVTQFIRAVPYYGESGVIAGFRVFPGAGSGPFSSWGLKSGDIITALDGSALVDADQATELLGALAEGASLTANVRRGADAVTVVLDGGDVMKINEANRAQRVAQQASQP